MSCMVVVNELSGFRLVRSFFFFLESVLSVMSCSEKIRIENMSRRRACEQATQLFSVIFSHVHGTNLYKCHLMQ